MAKRNAKDLGPEIKKRLNKWQSDFVYALQEKLAEDAPYETGRLASSWKIGKDSPNRSVEPERDTPGDVTLESFSGQITFGPQWYISSNIPYAETLALDPSFPIKTAARDWFTSIQNVKGKQIGQELFDQAFKGF